MLQLPSCNHSTCRVTWNAARSIRGGRLYSGKAEYISGSLSNSSVLKKLSQRSTKSPKKTEPIAPDGFEDEVMMEVLDPELEAGWSAEVVDEDEELDFQVESGDELLDFRLDPRFSQLSPNLIKELEEYQRSLKTQRKKPSDESSLETRTTATPHRKLKILGGDFRGRKLLSPRGSFVRPMMERVKAAIFDMLFANVPGTGFFPAGSRWLDLYAGTGAVGLEAISRGCEEVHFVEKDPWVVSAVLRKNIEECDSADHTLIRTMKVEDFLDRLIKLPQYSSGPFDFISVCPPYLQVSYPALQNQLAESGVLHDSTIIFMEYPRQLSKEIQNEIGNLKKIKDRSYGRTYLAVYGRCND